MAHKTKDHLEDKRWISLNSPALALVVEKKKAILCHSTTKRKEKLSSMCAPLIYQGKVSGLVVVETQGRDHIFVEEDETALFQREELHMLAGLALLVANGIANLQSYLERKKHAKRLEILNGITLKLSSLLDASTIYKETTKEVCKLLRCAKSSIMYLDGDRKVRIGHAVGISPKDREKIVISLEDGLVGWVMKNAKPLIAQSLPSSLSPSRRGKYFTDSFLIVPILEREKGNSKAMGAICAADRIDRMPFTKQDKELLTFIASQVGIALLNASLYKQATVDFLTGLYLRGYFFEKLREIIEEGFPFSLLMLDIDFFKPLNDAHGHQTGDIVLRELGMLLKKCIRHGDIAGRYGGEEFVILLPHIPYGKALKIAERIRRRVENFSFNAKLFPLRITVSIGVAEYQSPETPEKFLARCDIALYKAKNSGRNCVC